MIPPELWARLHPAVAAVLAFVVFVILPIVTLWMSLRAARQSARAAVLSEPTGNGFAAHVRAQLKEIREEQQRQRTDHRQDVDSLRADIRDIREQQTRDRRSIRDLLPHRGKVGSDV